MTHTLHVLVTGGTGTIGRALRATATDRTRISVLSRCEHRQVPLRPYHRCYVADVADKDAVRRAVLSCRPGVVIHAAAVKHVSTGEIDPLAAIRSNVEGTVSVCDAARLVGATVVLVSTDKAVQPTTAYGASKMLAERIVKDAGGLVVRYGNVFGSTGSFSATLLSEWRSGRGGQDQTYTVYPGRRYWWSPWDAARFVWASLDDHWARGATLYVPRLRWAPIEDIGTVCAPWATWDKQDAMPVAEKRDEQLVCSEDGPCEIGTVGDQACWRYGGTWLPSDTMRCEATTMGSASRMTLDDVAVLVARADEELRHVIYSD